MGFVRDNSISVIAGRRGCLKSQYDGSPLLRVFCEPRDLPIRMTLW